MRELKVGDRIKDNDKRMGGRVLVITAISTSRVTASRNGGGLRPTSILRNRIFTDEKQRKSGFSVVTN